MLCLADQRLSVANMESRWRRPPCMCLSGPMCTRPVIWVIQVKWVTTRLLVAWWSWCDCQICIIRPRERPALHLGKLLGQLDWLPLESNQSQGAGNMRQLFHKDCAWYASGVRVFDAGAQSFKQFQHAWNTTCTAEFQGHRDANSV